jgi:hypothetical protein
MSTLNRAILKNGLTPYNETRLQEVLKKRILAIRGESRFPVAIDQKKLRKLLKVFQKKHFPYADNPRHPDYENFRKFMSFGGEE